MKIRYKAIALFTAMTLGPVAAAVVMITSAARRPIQTSEETLQSALISEVAASPVRLLHEAEADALAVAAILGRAGSGAIRDDDALEAVRALVATREDIGAVRFEVPSANVSSVIRRDTSSADVPASTPALRSLADQRRVAFGLVGPTRGLVVARIPAAKADAPAGYVSVNVDLARLGPELRELAERRFGGGDARLLVATHDRRAVAAFGVQGVDPGASVADLPIWRSLPEGTPWEKRVDLVTQHVEGDTRMVGVLQTVPDLGWAVAIWRPEPVAFAALADLRRRGLWVAIAAAALAIAAGLGAAARVTRPVLGLLDQVRRIGQRRWRELDLGSKRDDEIGELTRALGGMAGDLEQGEREAKLRGDLSRYMSKALVDAIVRGEHSLALGGQRAEVSVLFADVVGFTPLAEQRGAEQVVAILNELFSVLSEVVFRHGGTVDKFIGDCIMAVWGAPVAQADHAQRALAAAEDMMRFLETANEGWREKYDIEVRLGIGVNSGDAIVGNIGSDKRMEYTVVGDVVNVAARLESIAQPNQVLVADTTRALAGEAFLLRRLGERKLTGRQTSTVVYELEIE